MSKSLIPYSSRNVRVVWNDYTLYGLSPDSAIEVAPNSDITESEVGMDGFIMHSFLPDDTGTVTLRFQQNSPANIYLSGILNLQKEQGSLVSSAMIISDPSGALATLRDVHIQSQPTVIRGSSATGQSMEWVFFIGSIDFMQIPGGVAGIAGVVADAIGAVDLARKYLLN